MSGSPFFILETFGESRAPLADPTTFGRASDNAVVLQDASVSGHHALIRKDGAFWVVEDLGSTNGTWLNHKRVDGRAVIKEGDRIQMGSQMIRVSGFRSGGDRYAPIPVPVPVPGCPRCAKPLPPGAAFCPSCGLPLAPAPPPAPTALFPSVPDPADAPTGATAPSFRPGSRRAPFLPGSRLALGCVAAAIFFLLGLLAAWWAWGGPVWRRAPGAHPAARAAGAPARLC